MTSFMTKSSSATDKALCSSMVSMSTENDDVIDDAEVVDGVDQDQHQQWLKRYEMPLFLLTQFNVHYLSWIKYPEHLADFINRFVCLFERIFHLPEFKSSNSTQDDSSTTADPKNQQLQEWLYEQSTEMCYSYRRQLLLRLLNVRSQTEGKKLRISLMEKDVKISEQMETDLDDVQQQTCPSLTVLSVLGDIDICSDELHILQLSEKINQKKEKHIYLKLALHDTASDAPTGDREFISILISEATITGYSGFTKRFNVKMNEKKKEIEQKEEESWLSEVEEEEEESIEFEVSLKWQIESSSYSKLVANPVTILRKLSGAIFLLGDYYWHFYSGFYRWAALDSEDPSVRYIAIQNFHELSLLLTPDILYYYMKDIFLAMYPEGGYPQPIELQPEVFADSCGQYTPEHVSMLDNLIVVFQHLFKEEQMDVVRRLVPFAGDLLRVRFNFIKRLVLLINQSLANYDFEELQTVVLPLATNLLKAIIDLQNKQEEEEAFLTDPRSGPQECLVELNQLTTHLATLVVETVQMTRPDDWANLSMDHPQMAITGCVLEQTIQAFFSPQAVDLLKAIYKQLRAKDILYDEHLASFFTSARIKKYRKWFR